MSDKPEDPEAQKPPEEQRLEGAVFRVKPKFGKGRVVGVGQVVGVGTATERETAQSIAPVIGTVSSTEEGDTSEAVGTVTEPDFRLHPTLDLKPLKHTSFYMEIFYSDDTDEAYEIEMLASDRGAVRNEEKWRDVDSDFATILLQAAYRIMNRMEGRPTLDPDD